MKSLSVSGEIRYQTKTANSIWYKFEWVDVEELIAILKAIAEVHGEDRNSDNEVGLVLEQPKGEVKNG